MRSAATAVCIATGVQCFTIGVLAPNLPREVCRPPLEVTQEASFAGITAVHLSNNDGAIRVHTHAKPETLVVATIRAYSESGEASETALAYAESLVRFDAEADQLTVSTASDAAPIATEMHVDYLVTVPEGTAIDIAGANGNVVVEPGCGAVRVARHNADLNLFGAQGDVSVKITNGRIRVNGLASRANLETMNGSIYIDGSSPDVRARTANGSIFALITDPELERCSLKSHNGAITLSVPATSSAQLRAATALGTVRLTAPEGLYRGVNEPRRLDGVLGEGGAEIVLEAVNGNITISGSSQA